MSTPFYMGAWRQTTIPAQPVWKTYEIFDEGRKWTYASYDILYRVTQRPDNLSQGLYSETAANTPAAKREEALRLLRAVFKALEESQHQFPALRADVFNIGEITLEGGEVAQGEVHIQELPDSFEVKLNISVPLEEGDYVKVGEKEITGFEVGNAAINYFINQVSPTLGTLCDEYNKGAAPTLRRSERIRQRGKQARKQARLAPLCEKCGGVKHG